jgi:hypothetical protein
MAQWCRQQAAKLSTSDPSKAEMLTKSADLIEETLKSN